MSVSSVRLSEPWKSRATPPTTAKFSRCSSPMSSQAAFAASMTASWIGIRVVDRLLAGPAVAVLWLDMVVGVLWKILRYGGGK